jgi:glycosyltransferase involved in cell wall biosynthesis
MISANYSQKKIKTLAVDLEPAPYKSDLWNAFHKSNNFDIFVIYTESKNWAKDGGHDFQQLPENNYRYIIYSGKGLIGVIQSSWSVMVQILRGDYDLVYISGYSSLPTIFALVFSSITRKKFILHVDFLNNGLPNGRFKVIKITIRDIFRGLVRKYGLALLVCGKKGVESAKIDKFSMEKIIDFPYVIDVDRIKSDMPKKIPPIDEYIHNSDITKIFFSGRMIHRKGLRTLLEALSKLNNKTWVLWIEGDGLEIEAYKDFAKELNIDSKCVFLGFCQYDTHSYLVRSADIVVVPSLEDPWGIVVDEGLQLGKAVVSSDATGSGFDRIKHNENGVIFPAGNVNELFKSLDTLLSDRVLRKTIGENAKKWDGNMKPIDNCMAIESIVKL